MQVSIPVGRASKGSSPQDLVIAAPFCLPLSSISLCSSPYPASSLIFWDRLPSYILGRLPRPPPHCRSSFPSALTLLSPPRFPVPSHRSPSQFSASLFLPSGLSQVSFTLRLLFYRRLCMSPFSCITLSPRLLVINLVWLQTLLSLCWRSVFLQRKRNGVIRPALIGLGLIGLNHFGEPQIERCH